MNFTNFQLNFVSLQIESFFSDEKETFAAHAPRVVYAERRGEACYRPLYREIWRVECVEIYARGRGAHGAETTRRGQTDAVRLKISRKM